MKLICEAMNLICEAMNFWKSSASSKPDWTKKDQSEKPQKIESHVVILQTIGRHTRGLADCKTINSKQSSCCVDTASAPTEMTKILYQPPSPLTHSSPYVNLYHDQISSLHLHAGRCANIVDATIYAQAKFFLLPWKMCKYCY